MKIQNYIDRVFKQAELIYMVLSPLCIIIGVGYLTMPQAVKDCFMISDGVYLAAGCTLITAGVVFFIGAVIIMGDDKR